MKKVSVKKVAFAGMLTAVIAVLSQVAFPLPSGVPVTLQTLAIALCGYVLGWKLGLASTLAYVALGTIGVPIFANLSGGPGVLLGMTGGFIFGFIPMVALCGISVKISSKIVSLALGMGGLLLCHVFGVVQFSIVTGSDIWVSVLGVSLPYLIKDVLSVAAAYFLSLAVRRGLSATQLAEIG